MILKNFFLAIKDNIKNNLYSMGTLCEAKERFKLIKNTSY